MVIIASRQVVILFFVNMNKIKVIINIDKYRYNGILSKNIFKYILFIINKIK